VCARDRVPYKLKKARLQSEERALGNTNPHQQMGSGLKFLVHFKKVVRTKRKKIAKILRFDFFVYERHDP
jgi:hypothetical protein